MHPQIRTILTHTLDVIETDIRLRALSPTFPDVHPVRFEMSWWCEHLTKPMYEQSHHSRPESLPDDINVCDTVACLAGHLAIQMGWPKIKNTHHVYQDRMPITDFTPDMPLWSAAVGVIRYHYGDPYYPTFSRQGAISIPIEEAITTGKIRYDVGMAEVIQRFLDLDGIPWDSLTAPSAWPEPFKANYYTATTELDRLHVTRARVLAWLESQETGASEFPSDDWTDPDDEGLDDEDEDDDDADRHDFEGGDDE